MLYIAKLDIRQVKNNDTALGRMPKTAGKAGSLLLKHCPCFKHDEYMYTRKHNQQAAVSPFSFS